MAELTKFVQVLLSPTDHKRLKKLAVDSDTSMSVMCRAIIKSYLSKRGR